MRFDDEEEDMLDEAEDPDEDSKEAEDTMACPYCRKQIHEDSVRCPYCENYISEEDTSHRLPLWMLIGFIACLAVAVFWALGG